MKAFASANFLDYYFVLRALHIVQWELFDRSNGSSSCSASSTREKLGANGANGRSLRTKRSD